MSDQKDTPTRKASRDVRMRRKDLLILRLADTNKRLKLRVQRLEKLVEHLKKPPLYKRLLTFIKQLFRLK
jgi:hypothetical protein